ncbi:hypothetical protein [Burkholderia diffusa]|uniref:hypothetical protein n=1 Tax=Burkholderia diffusa TaxID=488732 RepID=UPI00157B1CAD
MSARPRRADLPKRTTAWRRYGMPAALSRSAAVLQPGALLAVRIAGQIMRVAIHPMFPLDKRTSPLNRRHEQELVHHRQEFPTRLLRKCGEIEQQCEYLPYMAHDVPLQY